MIYYLLREPPQPHIFDNGSEEFIPIALLYTAGWAIIYISFFCRSMFKSALKPTLLAPLIDPNSPQVYYYKCRG